jgi:hypothetical protein
MTCAAVERDEREQHLNVKSLLAASDVLSALQEAFGEIKEPSKEGAMGCAALNVAQTYVIELAAHLQAGVEYDAAISATVRGDMKIT